ncbi:hypothetical protein ACGF12_15960 [Kitasatospora sp. NPDC048296]|uniref:hypothetical protein n=1 Tax=Kitasatospora sp. NPDC048296 TaxID=3364048 RepID=UPI003718340D
MTRIETPPPGPGARPPGGRSGRAGRGSQGGRNDVPWPKRPLRTALWIPAAAVLLPLGGALGAFGLWFLVPSLLLVITGLVGLLYALVSLCQSGPLRLVALALLLAPLIGVPLLSVNSAQAAVLSMRGVAHPGTVTDVRVSHGKTTTYSCAVRYEDAPGRSGSVRCGAGDSAGERVSVTEDPGGLVDPEFTDQAANPRFDLALDGLADLTLLVIATVVAAVGALLHRLKVRRNPVAGATG